MYPNSDVWYYDDIQTEYLDKEVLNVQHYGMPDNHTVCIGSHWERSPYTLLTAPGCPISLVEPGQNYDGSPHGFGLAVRNPHIEFGQNAITIGEKTFQRGESINIGLDALNRCSSSTDNLDDYVSGILDVCPGKIIGKLHQIVSISKDGTKIW